MIVFLIYIQIFIHIFIHSFHVYWTIRCQLLFQTFSVSSGLHLHGGSIKLFILVPSCETSVQCHTLEYVCWVHWISQESLFMCGMESFISPLTRFAKRKTLVICFASPSSPLAEQQSEYTAKESRHISNIYSAQGLGENGAGWRCAVLCFLTRDRALGEEQSLAILLLFFMLCLNTHRIKIRNWSQTGKHSEG